MYKKSAIFLGFLVLLCSGEADYYWQIFDGIAIPAEALLINISNDGDLAYIAKTRRTDVESHQEGYDVSEIYNPLHISQNETLKVLCTPYPERFSWMRVKRDQLSKIKNKHPVEAGREGQTTTYVAKLSSGEKALVRKVECDADSCSEIIGNDCEDFEVLVYCKPSKRKSCETVRNTNFLRYFFVVLGAAVLVVLVIAFSKRCYNICR